MEIRLPVRVSATPPLQAGAQSLKLGNILRAIVETELKDNAFLLRLDSGGRALVAYSSANLKPGQVLELEVVKLGTTPELRILSHGVASATSESTVQQALCLFLPKQEPLADVIPELHRLIAQARQTSALPAPVTEALENLLASIPKKSELMSAEGMEKGLSNSGVFLEAKLAGAVDSSADFVDSDFKARLLRVLDSLKTLQANPGAAPDAARASTNGEPPGARPHTQPVMAEAGEQTELPALHVREATAAEETALADERNTLSLERGDKDSLKLRGDSPPAASRGPEHELSAARRAASSASDDQKAAVPGNEFGVERIVQKVEAALARVVMDQLASLPGNDAAPSVWQLEIPFTDGPHQDTARLLIAKDAKPVGADGTDCWSLTLELHPPELGTFCARIVLKGERIDTYLWSDTATTSDLIREQCERLRARLHGAGLVVGQLTPLDRPPDLQRSETPSPPLLDLRA
jgi:hypothetical protein